MSKKLYRVALLALAFCAGAIMLGKNISAQEGIQSARVRKLVDESAKKKAIDESSLLNENPLMPGDIPEALANIKKHPDYTSYHLLRAVREYYPASYKEATATDKAAILCSALNTSIYLNDWGYLSLSKSYDGESAKALVEIGKPALIFLQPILDSDKESPLFGSKEATMSKIYGYRRKDFACRYISLILKQTPPVFSKDAKERDKDIEAMKAKLKKDTK